jgi:hypothetical protein
VSEVYDQRAVCRAGDGSCSSQAGSSFERDQFTVQATVAVPAVVNSYDERCCRECDSGGRDPPRLPQHILVPAKAARRSETVTRQERLRQDQLSACSEFAAAVSDLRRSVIAVWFRKKRKDRRPADDEATADYRMAYAEADRLGAVAETAKFRMLLVINDPSLRELADAAFRHVGAVSPARDKAEVEKLDAEFDAHMTVFVATAARLLG